MSKHEKLKKYCSEEQITALDLLQIAREVLEDRADNQKDLAKYFALILDSLNKAITIICAPYIPEK